MLYLVHGDVTAPEGEGETMKAIVCATSRALAERAAVEDFTGGDVNTSCYVALVILLGKEGTDWYSGWFPGGVLRLDEQVPRLT